MGHMVQMSGQNQAIPKKSQHSLGGSLNRDGVMPQNSQQKLYQQDNRQLKQNYQQAHAQQQQL